MDFQITKRLKVYVVEGSAVVRESLNTMLTGVTGVKMVGFAVDEAGAINGVDVLLPDVVILDLNLQQGTGLNVLIDVKKHHAAIKIVVLSNYANALYVSACKKAGADYFFDKSFQFLLVVKVLEQMISEGRSDEKIASLQS